MINLPAWAFIPRPLLAKQDICFYKLSLSEIYRSVNEKTKIKPKIYNNVRVLTIVQLIKLSIANLIRKVPSATSSV